MTQSTKETRALTEALELAGQGFRIFPLRPGTKLPYRDFAWKEEATRDTARIREWAEEHPGCNFAVATGAGSLLVDADTKNGKLGLDSLENLEVAYGLPQSFRVKTPSGGVHVYLKSDESFTNFVDSIPGHPGIDIRSDGGYVVAPGSIIDGKSYEALPGTIEPAGNHFLSLLKSAGSRHRQAVAKAPAVELDLPEHVSLAVEYLTQRAPEAVEGAGGNETTYRVAAQCRDFGLSPDTTFDLMLEHWNEQKAFPAWLPADLQTVVGNAYKYATGGWGSTLAIADFEPVDIDVGVSPMVAKIAEEAGATVRGLPAGVLDYAAMLAHAEPEWLIDGLIPEKRSSLWFGQSNTFKSFLAIDAALAIATGRAWHGRAVKQRRVLYVATEGAIGVGKQRVPGWYGHHEVPSNLRNSFFVDTNEIAMDSDESAAKLAQRCRQLDIGLVVLDIFGGTMNGTETEDTTARAWVKNLNRRLKEGVTVLTVAHTGWQDRSRARMHTHFWGSFDSRVKIEGDKDKLTTLLTVERHKDADSRWKWAFRLLPSNGTLVPEMDLLASPRTVKPLSPVQRLALEILKKTVAAQGAVPDWLGGPDQLVVQRGEWKKACFGHLSDGKGESAHRNAFDRAAEKLAEYGRIEAYGEYVWLSAEE